MAANCLASPFSAPPPMPKKLLGSQTPPTLADSDAVWARQKPININISGGTVSGTNRTHPWDTI